MLNFAWLIFFFPALGALISIFGGRRLGRKTTARVASIAVIAAFVAALGLFAGITGLPEAERHVEIQLWQWISIGDFRIDMSMLIDPLSVFMALVVTGVGAVIHIYASEYMKLDDHHKALDDRRYARFFAYMNFFILMMLVLVLANNYVMLYMGWEGVGLASYLLIGFWFHRPSAGDAAKKAFLVNRVGDFGLAIAIFWLFLLFGKEAGSLAFGDIFEAVEHASPVVIASLTGVTLLMFFAATGKSAQLPLFVWLPDAMEGPTPVSALIHAATMVTAGVYLLVRSNPLLELAPTTMTIIAWVGALTALMAASIAIVQTDLKRILAYSTISQLGFMFLAVGMGVYVAAIFHLATHAFFKALLFLAAGSVMHALHGELNIDLMGGLKKKLPRTYAQYLIGSLALAGFPLLAGFWSKDEILFGTYLQSKPLYIIALFTALLTAVYSFRAVYRAFFGKPRDEHLYEIAHEQPRGMTGPLWILAFGAIFGGVFGIPAIIGELAGIEHINLIEGWLEPALEGMRHLTADRALVIGLFISSGITALIGIFIAYSRYVRESSWSQSLQRVFSPLQPILEHKYWVDEIYMAIIVNPLRAIARFFYRFGDQSIIEGIVNGVGRLTVAIGNGVAHLQSGYISLYALSLFVGVIVVLAYFLMIG